MPDADVGSGRLEDRSIHEKDVNENTIQDHVQDADDGMNSRFLRYASMVLVK